MLEKITPPSPEAVEVLRRANYGMNRTLVNEDEPAHMARRRVLLDAFTPEALAILVLSLVGFVVSARSLQIGPAVSVIAITNAFAIVCTIASGPVVFGEPLPEDALGVAVRALAFSLVIFAAALTPGPVERRKTTAVGA